jgi:hypothetical protein
MMPQRLAGPRQFAAILISAALLLGGAASTADAQDTKRALPRFALADNDTIWLGRPLGRFARYATVDKDSLVRIPTPLFEGAEGLLVMRDSSDVVQRIVYLYGEQRNVDQMMKELFTDYGREKTYSTAPVPDGIRESWVWFDKRTEFTFTRFTPAQNKMAAVAVLVTFGNDPVTRTP